MGNKLFIEHEWLGDTYAFKIMVMQRMRGERAWTRIEEINSSNDPPPPGFEYMLVRIWFQYPEGPTADTSYWVTDSDFTVVSSEGKDYESCFVVAPEPSLDAELYPGASHHGWAVFMVEEQDEKPLMTFGRDYQGRGGIWWQLY